MFPSFSGAKYPPITNWTISTNFYPPTSQNFAGEIDEVRIWSITRDAFQMAQSATTKISPTVRFDNFKIPIIYFVSFPLSIDPFFFELKHIVSEW
jgi:hypothetical protein